MTAINDLTTLDLRQMMGASVATEADADAMLDLLLEHYDGDTDVDDIPDADWMRLLDTACGPRIVEVPTTAELRSRSHDGGCDARYTAEWTEASEGKTWELPCYLIRRGDHVIMWSCTDESGVADVTVAATEDDIDEQVREFAEDLADDLAL